MLHLKINKVLSNYFEPSACPSGFAISHDLAVCNVSQAVASKVAASRMKGLLSAGNAAQAVTIDLIRVFLSQYL